MKIVSKEGLIKKKEGLNMAFTKQELIETLKIMIEDEGDCRRLTCPRCYRALFNEDKVSSCHDTVAKFSVKGENTWMTRFRIAKKRLKELTSGIILDSDEETIILDQNQ